MDRGVTAVLVVPGVDPFEDGQGQLAAVGRAVLVEKVQLKGVEETLEQRIGPHGRMRLIRLVSLELSG